MDRKKIERLIIIVTAVFVVLSLLFMFGGSIFRSSGKSRRSDSTVMPEATSTTSEIKRGAVIEQDFINTSDTISKVGIVFARNAYREGINIVIELLEGSNVLASASVDSGAIEDQHRTYVEPSAALTGMKNKQLTLRIYPDSKDDTGLMVMMSKDADSTFRFDNKTVKGTLCFSVTE